MASRAMKVLTVGDDTVGKTSLLTTYIEKQFPADYAPVVFENTQTKIMVDGAEFDMVLWDVDGLSGNSNLRSLSYSNTACFLVCFSVSDRTSFENVSSQWIPELKFHCPNAAIVLVGTKSDLRDEAGTDVIPQKECEALRQEIRAVSYVECSAKNNNLDDVFAEAIRASLKKKSGVKPCNTL